MGGLAPQGAVRCREHGAARCHRCYGVLRMRRHRGQARCAALVQLHFSHLSAACLSTPRLSTWPQTKFITRV